MQRLPKKAIVPLKRVQNAAARLITKTYKREHVAPVLKCLHWLPVHFRIQYKIIYQIHKTVHGNGSAPTYLRDLVRPANRSRVTHASSGHNYRLAVNRTKTKYGDRS
jgi:hypothetical protein